MIEVVTTGVTRTVILTPRLAIKIAGRRGRYLVRGWLANRSEWKQWKRRDANEPGVSLFHLVTVSRRAELLGTDTDFDWDEVEAWASLCGYQGDEVKLSSWGRVGGRWVLIDFDRSWEKPYGLVGAIYQANQDRLGRKWSKL